MLSRDNFWPVIVAICMAVLLPRVSVAAEPAKLTFEEHIRPIFKSYCFQCHGESKELAGGLDLRLRRLLVAGGESGAAIEPSDSAASMLLDYVESGEMPPDEEVKLSPEQVALIARWIKDGAPTAQPEPKTAPKPGEIFFTEQDRSHWSFRPIQRPPVPTIQKPNLQSDNPIDAFIARKLHANGLTFSPEAEKLTLIRRATFDLLGMPPTPQEVDAFLADDSPQAYEKLIDRLLASPHYGERWARHWLDVAGYADSEGYNDKDVVRTDAWLYRDYVIRSLNADKPWNQFIVEQLAGDELARATHSNAQALANRDAKARDLLTATGFLRLAPDGSGSSPMDPAVARNQVVTGTVKVVSSSLLGMTMGCAECHHHRFDPILQEDFYRMRAVFEPVFDMKNWRMPNARRSTLFSQADQEKAAKIEAEAKKIDAKHVAEKQKVLEIILGRVLKTIPADQRDYARQAFETPLAKRTPEQEKFVKEKYPMLKLLRPGALHLFIERFKDKKELYAKYKGFEEQAAKVREAKPLPDFIRVATEDTKHVPATHVFARGDISSPQPDKILPGGLKVLAGNADNTFAENDAKLATTGRRLAYARYLTSGQHPLVARVLVNRFWMHHFGSGLVDTPGDFGMNGSLPSHAGLLDWLAADFMDGDWRLKRLHKIILTSRTYRQVSRRQPEAEKVDTGNRLLWRMPVRRLEAEIVRDAMLSVSGRLDRQPFGQPIPVSLNIGGLIEVAGEKGKAQKRSVYVQVRRTQPVAMFEAFDAPKMEPNCERRVVSTVATQSLALMNGQFVLDQSAAFAARVIDETGKESKPAQRIGHLWKLAFGGTPSNEEMAKLQEFLQAQTVDFRARKVADPDTQALASLCQVMFGTNKFLYVD